MGVKLGAITNWASSLLGSYKIPFSTGTLTRLVSLDNLAAWVVQTASAFVQSGTGAVAETVQTALQRFIWAAQFTTFANALTAAASKRLRIGVTTTISTNTTIPSTVETYIENGGGFSISAGQTLTINGPFKAGDYQVFSGLGTVTFASNPSVEINPMWWGASPSASGATNVAAINASLTAMHTSGKWLLPLGSYNCTGKIATTKTYIYASINFDGLLISDASADGIEFAFDVTVSKISVRGIYTRAVDFISAPNYVTVYGNALVGLHVKKNFQRNIVKTGYISGWETGIYLDVTSASAESNTWTVFAQMDNNKYDLRFKATTAPAYVSNNTFGTLDCTMSDANAVTAAAGNEWCVFMDAQASAPTSNTFLRPVWQTKKNGMYAQGSNGWSLVNPYIELNVAATTALDLRNSYNFSITGSGITSPDIADMGSKLKVNSGTKGFTVNGLAYTQAGSKNGILTGTVIDPLSSQYQPRANAWGDERVDIVYDFTQFDAYKVSSYQQPNHPQVLNKLMEGSAAPTDNGETYAQNAVVWNTNLAAAQPMCFICSGFGTAGTLNGGLTTANTTASSNAIVVSSVTGLKTGQVITVAGTAGFLGRYITGISGTTVTLSGAAALTTTNAQAVSFFNPTWRNGPALP